MKSILEQLYNGEIKPYLKYDQVVGQYKEKKERAFQSYTQFLEKLPEELREEFIDLIDEQIELLPCELEQNFIDGFRTGVQMMVEVYSGSS